MRPRRGRSRSSARRRRRKRRSAARARASRSSRCRQQIAEGGMKELPIIVKADVQGSAEVLGDTLTKLTDEKVKVRIIHSGVGAINESDVLLATASNAIIIGFNVRPGPQRRRRGRAREGRRPAALGHLQRRRRDEEGDDRPARPDVQGSADRRGRRCARPSRCRSSAPSPAAWSPKAASRARATPRRACCATTSWSTRARSARCAASRTTCREVKTGFECGIGFEKYNDLKVGDIIEVFVSERVKTPV